jgi:Neuraminidase (sialidase)
MPTNVNGIDNDRLYPSPYTVIDKSNTSNKGNIYVSFTASGIETTSGNANDVYLARSTDNGYNWSKPFRVHDDAEGISQRAVLFNTHDKQ